MKSQAQTCIPFTPRPYQVVIECTFEVSILNITNPDVIKQLQPKKTRIVAVGEGISDLEINDNVLIASTQALNLVNFEWNNQALKVKQDIYVKGKGIMGSGSITAKEYFITNDSNILGVHDNNKDAC
jgi:hypothetical protein